MSIFEVFLIGVSLSMDAFAVSICKGMAMKKANIKWTVIMALFFGGFQALMPIIGWYLGKQFESVITNIDHWVAFALLGFIGGKMIYEFFKDDEEYDLKPPTVKEIFFLAIATSIDALAVGITFAFIKVDIWSSALIIGITTFVISAIGVLGGSKLGERAGDKANLLGGVILVLIGIKILAGDLLA